MQESNFVFGLVVGLKEISGLQLEGLEEVIGGVLRPFHQIQIVVNVWAIGVNHVVGTWSSRPGTVSDVGVGCLDDLAWPRDDSR